MAGNKAVQAAPIVVHHVYLIHQNRVVRWAEALEIGFAESGSKLIGNGDGQGYHQQNEKDIPHVVVFNQHIKQHYRQWNPRTGLGDGHHKTVPKQRVAAIKLQQKLLIVLYESLPVHN